MTVARKKDIFLSMKSVLEYKDYHLFMQDYYDERKRLGAFSWREFCKSAGFTSPNFLKLVCMGQSKLSKVKIDDVAKAMGLSGYEADYFREMVLFCNADKENEDVGTFADGSFTIDNVQLEAEQDIVPDIFEATNPANNVPIYEVNEEDDLNRLIAYLFPSEDETDEPLKAASNVEQKVLFVQPLTIMGESNGTPVDMTLIQGTFDSSLEWSSILNSDRYQKLIASLQNVKVLKEVFTLTELDLKTFDETKPVYLAQYGHYYAVLEIKSSETGVAEVTLFQLEL